MFFIHILEKSNAQGAWNHRFRIRSMYKTSFLKNTNYHKKNLSNYLLHNMDNLMSTGVMVSM